MLSISSRSVLILYSHLRLDLAIELFPSDFLLELCVNLSLPYLARVIILILIAIIIFDEESKS
jgi:hypothetical protein